MSQRPRLQIQLNKEKEGQEDQNHSSILILVIIILIIFGLSVWGFSFTGLEKQTENDKISKNETIENGTRVEMSQGFWISLLM